MQCFIKQNFGKHFCLKMFNSLYDKIWIVCINNECERELLEIKPAKHVTNRKRRKNDILLQHNERLCIQKKRLERRQFNFRIFFIFLLLLAR